MKKAQELFEIAYELGKKDELQETYILIMERLKQEAKKGKYHFDIDKMFLKDFSISHTNKDYSSLLIKLLESDGFIIAENNNEYMIAWI